MNNYDFRPHDIGIGGYLDMDVVKKINLQLYSPEEYFSMALDKAIQQVNNLLESKGQEPIKNETKVRELALKMPHHTFKNATTFILAYLFTTIGEAETFKLLPNFKESENIEKVDVLRYTRFILGLIND